MLAVRNPSRPARTALACNDNGLSLKRLREEGKLRASGFAALVANGPGPVRFDYIAAGVYKLTGQAG